MQSIQLAVSGDRCCAEDLDYFIQCRLAGFDQFAGQLIGIDDRHAECAEALCNGCFAAANAAGQAYHQCVFALSAQGRGVTSLNG